VNCAVGRLGGGYARIAYFFGGPFFDASGLIAGGWDEIGAIWIMRIMRAAGVAIGRARK
jgi:hypothetical protein